MDCYNILEEESRKVKEMWNHYTWDRTLLQVRVCVIPILQTAYYNRSFPCIPHREKIPSLIARGLNNMAACFLSGGQPQYSAWHVKEQFKSYKGTIFITAQKIYHLEFCLKSIYLVVMLSFLLKGDSFSLQIIISSEENSCTVLPP